MAWDWVVPPPNCTPGARSPLKAEPKDLGDLHQPVTPEGARQTPDAQSGARGRGLQGVGTPERDPRPSMAAPATPQGSGEHSVLDVMSCKLNTTHPPARLPPAQVPTRPGTSGIYDSSPLLETLGPPTPHCRPGLSQEFPEAGSCHKFLKCPVLLGPVLEVASLEDGSCLICSS